MTTLFPPSPLACFTSSAFFPAPTLTETSPETVYIVPPRSCFVSLPLVIVAVSIADAPPAAISAMTRIIEWFFMCFSLSL